MNIFVGNIHLETFYINLVHSPRVGLDPVSPSITFGIGPLFSIHHTRENQPTCFMQVSRLDATLAVGLRECSRVTDEFSPTGKSVCWRCVTARLFCVRLRHSPTRGTSTLCHFAALPVVNTAVDLHETPDVLRSCRRFYAAIR